MSLRDVTVWAGTIAQVQTFIELVRARADGTAAISAADIRDAADSTWAQLQTDLSFHPKTIIEIAEWKREGGEGS